MKTIKHNGRIVKVQERRRKGSPHRPSGYQLTTFVACKGRYLINCTHGPGCPGHTVKWILTK